MEVKITDVIALTVLILSFVGFYLDKLPLEVLILFVGGILLYYGIKIGVRLLRHE